MGPYLNLWLVKVKPFFSPLKHIYFSYIPSSSNNKADVDTVTPSSY